MGVSGGDKPYYIIGKREFLDLLNIPDRFKIKHIVTDADYGNAVKIELELEDGPENGKNKVSPR